MDITRARAEVSEIYQETLLAVDPEKLVRQAVSLEGPDVVIAGTRHRLDAEARIVVLAVGKAAVPMARGAYAALGGRIARGLAVTKHGNSRDGNLGPIEIVEASHPVPDETSLAAGERLLALAESLRAPDLAVVLVSGGGSSLVESPRSGIELRDITRATDLLLRAGADIQTLNAVRRRISRVKAGGLARACAPARVVNLIVSDVLGNPLPMIASGLSVDPGQESSRDLNWVRSSAAWNEMPACVRDALASNEADIAARVTNVVQTEILADAETAARAAAAAARSLGYRAEILSTRFAGEAKEFGRFWSQLALEIRRHGEPFVAPICLVGSGEMTVTVRGDGVGGRNTEMALSSALEIEGAGGIAVASLATDGDDGMSKAAGGVVTGESAATARRLGVQPEELLANNDSARFLAAVDGLLVTGPTGTNVNDIYLALLP